MNKFYTGSGYENWYSKLNRRGTKVFSGIRKESKVQRYCTLWTKVVQRGCSGTGLKDLERSRTEQDQLAVKDSLLGYLLTLWLDWILLSVTGQTTECDRVESVYSRLQPLLSVTIDRTNWAIPIVPLIQALGFLRLRLLPCVITRLRDEGDSNVVQLKLVNCMRREFSHFDKS